MIFVMKSWISLFLGGLTHFLENMHSRQTTLPGSLYWYSNVMMVTFREHEINSHIGSGYDLWRNDNVTRDGEGLYRLYIVWDHIRNDCTIYISSTFLWEEETSRLLTSLANSSKPWSDTYDYRQWGTILIFMITIDLYICQGMCSCPSLQSTLHIKPLRNFCAFTHRFG